MIRRRIVSAFGGTAALLLSGFLLSQAQESRQNTIAADDGSAVVLHPECVYFGDTRDKFAPPPAGSSQSRTSLSAVTGRVAAQLAFIPGGSRTGSFDDLSNLGTIDKYLYQDMQAAGVTPATKSTDWEFIRRATLDLIGRIPAPDQVLSFVNDRSPDKRSQLIDQLLNRPEWVDKWTMYFGDMYKNTPRSTFVVRYEPARNAFYQWIHDSLANNKSYQQMASELITAAGPNSYSQGELNWLVGGWVIGTPQQDNIDQEAADVAETFLGISHMNCLLCHNGRGHLDALSLWGSQSTRYMARGFSSFLSHTTMVRTPLPNAVNNQPYYWGIITIRPESPITL